VVLTPTPTPTGTRTATPTPTSPPAASPTPTPTPTPTPSGPLAAGPVAVAFAAVPANGCLACGDTRCECGSTPTPTPEYDGLGRRVFRPSGATGFMLVVEAVPGTSGVFPGAREPVTCSLSAGRPDLQIESARRLGTGPDLVCPLPVGTPAIPAFSPADFGPSSAVTVALQEFGARFDPNHTSAEGACTKDGSGEANFLSSPPPPTPARTNLRQYCYVVDSGASFPSGDTVLTVQVSDTAPTPNVGPTAQIVVRVGP